MSEKADILCITAHPDDVELCFGGTVIKHVEQGHSVGIVDLTRGELGTRGSVELRKQEADKAMGILGAAFRYQLELADGFFQVDEPSLLAVIKVIRAHQPRLVITNALRDRHPDHGQGARLVSKAAFLAGLIRIETGQDVWRPDMVLNGIQDRNMKPTLIVDVTDQHERKMQAIMAFSSQFYNPDSEEPASPISSKEFLDFIEGRALEYGRLIGTRYGEGFVSQRPIGVDDLTTLR